MKEKKHLYASHNNTENIRDVTYTTGIDYNPSNVLIESHTNITNENSKIKNIKAYPTYIKFTAKLQKCDVPGGNGIIYSTSLMKDALLNNMGSFISDRKFLGEMDHPDIDLEKQSKSYILTRLGMVLYKEAACLVTDIWFEGNEIWGRVETLSERGGSGLGDKLAGMVMQKIPIAFSFRGLGEKVVRGDKIYVDHFYRVVSYDAVTRPSFGNAWLQTLEEQFFQESNNKILKEGSNVMKEKELLMESNASLGFDFKNKPKTPNLFKNVLLSGRYY